MSKTINGMNASQQYARACRRKDEATIKMQNKDFKEAASKVKKHATHLDHAVELEFGKVKEMKEAIENCLGQFIFVRNHLQNVKPEKGYKINTLESKIKSCNNNKDLKETSNLLKQKAQSFLKDVEKFL